MRYLLRITCTRALPVLAVCMLAGCGGEVLAVKDKEIAELRFQNARKQDSLVDVLAKLEALEAELQAADSEREAAVKLVAQLESTVRAQQERQDQLQAETGKVEERAKRAERAYEVMKKTLAQVQLDASATVDELAELRLRRDEFDKATADLNARNAALHKENTRLVKQVDEIRSKLLKEQAVVRALSISDSVPNANVEVFQEQIRNLEKAKDQLVTEKRNLIRMIESLKRKMAAGGSEAEGAASEPIEVSSLLQQEPEELWRSLAGLVKVRSQNAIRGEFTWDGFDFALLGGAAALLVAGFWFLLAPLRWWRRRRARNELQMLRRRVHDLEAQDAAEVAGAPGKPRQRSRSFVRRRGQFSPIISSQEQAQAADEQYADEASDVEGSLDEEVEDSDDATDTEPFADDDAFDPDMEVTVTLGRSVESSLEYDAPIKPPATQKQAPAPTPQWNAADEDEDDLEDEFANTQIISGVDGLSGLGELESLDLPDGGGFSAAKKKAKPSKEPTEKKKEDERELLNELKEIIGQKFDELNA